MPSGYVSQNGTPTQPKLPSASISSQFSQPQDDYYHNSAYNRRYNVPSAIQTGNVPNQNYYQPGSAVVGAQASSMFPDSNEISPFAKLASPNGYSPAAQSFVHDRSTDIGTHKEISKFPVCFLKFVETWVANKVAIDSHASSTLDNNGTSSMANGNKDNQQPNKYLHMSTEELHDEAINALRQMLGHGIDLEALSREPTLGPSAHLLQNIFKQAQLPIRSSPPPPPNASASSSAPAAGFGRPTANGEWWSISQDEWDKMNRSRKIQVSHAGIIMEGENGMIAADRCLRCRELGFECWQYSEEIRRQHTGTKTRRRKFGPSCARCRRAGKECVAGPETDQDLQANAAALQHNIQLLQTRVESPSTRVQSSVTNNASNAQQPRTDVLVPAKPSPPFSNGHPTDKSKKQAVAPPPRVKPTREEYLAALAKAKEEKQKEIAPVVAPVEKANIETSAQTSTVAPVRMETHKLPPKPPPATTPKSKVKTNEVLRRLAELKRSQETKTTPKTTTPSTSGIVTSASITPAPLRLPEAPLSVLPPTVSTTAVQSLPLATSSVNNESTATVPKPNSMLTPQPSTQPTTTNTSSIAVPGQDSSLPITGFFNGQTSSATPYPLSGPTNGTLVTISPMNGPGTTPRRVRYRQEESVIIDVSSEDEANEEDPTKDSDLESGELRSSNVTPMKPTVTRPSLSRVSSLPTSGNQTPEHTIRLQAIESEKAKLQKLIEMKEQEKRRKAMQAPTPPLNTRLTPSVTSLPTNPITHPRSTPALSHSSRASSVKPESEAARALRLAKIKQLQLELARLEAEEEIDDVMEGLETEDTNVLDPETASMVLQESIDPISIDERVTRIFEELDQVQPHVPLESISSEPQLSDSGIQPQLDSGPLDELSEGEIDMDLDSPIKMTHQITNMIVDPLTPPHIEETAVQKLENHQEDTRATLPDAPMENLQPLDQDRHGQEISKDYSREHIENTAVNRTQDPHKTNVQEDNMVVSGADGMVNLIPPQTKSPNESFSESSSDYDSEAMDTDDEEYEPEATISAINMSDSRSTENTPPIVIADDVAPELRVTPAPVLVRINVVM